MLVFNEMSHDKGLFCLIFMLTINSFCFGRMTKILVKFVQIISSTSTGKFSIKRKAWKIEKKIVL